MDIKQYQAEAESTKSTQFHWDALSPDIQHAIIGLSTEANEMLDHMKKVVFYGKPVDHVNLDEEVGDILWYVAIYANARGTTIEALAETNNRKLKHRYPERFSSERAAVRDLVGERSILEGGV